MERADPADSLAPEQIPSVPETVVRYGVEIGSLSLGLEGGQGAIEAAVDITEYVNDEYVTNVVVTSSVIVERETPLSLIEDRLLTSTREALKRLPNFPMRTCEHFSTRPKKTRTKLTRIED
jgi:hypothetical protein